MSGLRGHVEDYLGLRRALGFKLERAGRLLPQFVNYLEAAGAATVTTELAIAWARQPVSASPRHWAARLAVVRGFAAYLQTLDPEAEVPPPGVFPARRHRPTPYLWSQQDIYAAARRGTSTALTDASRHPRSPVRPTGRLGHAGR